MNWKAILIFFLLAVSCKPSLYVQKKEVQLAKPILNADEIFFEDHTLLHASATEPDAHIEMNINGATKIKYKNPIKISESSTVEAQSVGGGFIQSDVSYVGVWKLPKNEIISVSSDRPLDEKYGTLGLDILIDRKKGKNDFNNGWLGYLGDTVEFDLQFDIIDIDHILISTMRNQNAWIFSPSQINVIVNEEVVSSQKMDEDIKEASSASIYNQLDLTGIETREVKIQIIAPKEIPDWHPGAGQKPWLFIDEILIY